MDCWSVEQEVRLLRPLAEDAVTSCEWSSYCGEDFGLIAAICATFDHEGVWEWKDVFSWQESENAPGVREWLAVFRAPVRQETEWLNCRGITGNIGR